MHVDCVTTRHDNPTFAFREYRIFVDGLLAGRGGVQACGLGAARTDLPAVAVCDEGRAVVVTENQQGTPVVEM
jgi:hypothetical protein